jgi:hypothetical protein
MKISQILIIAAIIIAVQGSLTIIDPPTLISQLGGNATIKYSLAKFGDVPYNTNVLGQLYYPEPHNGCHPFDRTGIFFSYNYERDPANNPIIVVDRGGCVLTTKAKYAQLAGAKMLVIIDSTDEDVSQMTFPDNGQGKFLHIPTVVINKNDGDIIKNFLMSTTVNSTTKSTVVMKMFFPAKLDVTKIKLKVWYSAANADSMKFFKAFKPYFLKIAPSIDFEPNVVLWYCTYCKNLGFNVESENDCFSGGRYCAPDPDNLGPASGRDVVTEDLRQKCIWSNRDASDFFDYITSKEEACGADATMQSTCHKKVYDKLGWDDGVQTALETCWEEGFAGKNYYLDDNSVLKEEREAYIDEGVQYWPSVFIEHQHYAGDLTKPEELFNAICDKFTNNKPQACLIDAKVDVNAEHTDWFGILVIVGSMLLLLSVALFCYKRSLKRDMMREMNTQVSTMIGQYYALNEGKAGRSRKDEL